MPRGMMSCDSELFDQHAIVFVMLYKNNYLWGRANTQDKIKSSAKFLE